jgi:hypothetical protein
VQSLRSLITALRSLAAAASIASLAMLAPAGMLQAHHSPAMFDTSKTVTLEGTLKLAELTTPHAWFWVSVPKDNGETQLWGGESGAGGGNVIAAVARKSNMSVREFFAPGQTVTMIIHPLRDGRPGGEVVSIRFPDGRAYVALPVGTPRN